MPNNTIYANTDSHQVGHGGGVQSVDAVAAGSTTQLNSGTSLPCRVVWLSGRTIAGAAYYSFASTNVSLGAHVPTASVGPVEPLQLHIDDVSKIWIFASTAVSVHCTYMF
jgi:hypothetical protein